jgi:hypothetical protein
MSPIQKHAKEFLAEGTSQPAIGQDLNTVEVAIPTTHIPQTSQNHPAQPTITYPPPPPQHPEPLHQSNSSPTFRTIHSITRGSNKDFQSKRQKREYYSQVNHMAAEGLVTRTKWSDIPLTFIEADIKLVSFPRTDVMVIIAHIDKWDITRVLIDNDSQAKILFLSAFDQMGFDMKQLKEAMKSLYGFGGRRIEHVDSIPLPVSFVGL